MNNKFFQDIKNNKPIIIVANVDYFPLLLKYKDVKANIKLMHYTQAISTLTFEVNEKMMAELIRHGYEYTKAKKVLYRLQLLTPETFKMAPEMLKEAYNIVKPYLTNSGYKTSAIFDNKQIYLFNAKEDIQIFNLFKAKGYECNHLSFEDLNIKQEFKPNKEVINFDNKLEQYLYIFADIRKRLLAKPELSSKIRIIANDMYDVFYANYLSSMFGIKIYLNISTPLYNQPQVIKVLKYFYNNKKIDVSVLTDKDPAILELLRIIKCYELDKLDFEQGYLNLVEVTVQTEYLETNMEDSGVVVTNIFTMNDSYLTYITCFQDDIFYKSFKDDDVIADIQKKELKTNPSYLETLISKQKMSLFTTANNNVLISRVKQHLNEHIYDSGLIESLKMKQRNFDLSNEDDLNELLSKSFTDNGAETLAAILKDRGFDLPKFKLVQSYNNQPRDLKVKPKDSYSITDIQDWNKCPFKYLLDHELKMSSIDDKYFANLGTLIHSVLEHIDESTFDYDRLYDEATEQFKKNMIKTSHGPYDPKYDVFIIITKKWFKTIADEYRSRLKASPNVKLMKEVNFNFTIPETDYSFNGKIDALLISKIAEKSFYSIVDYKTGSDVFEPLAVCCGLNIQLPMYFGGIVHSDQKDLVSGSEKGGFGLKKVLGNSPNKLTNGKKNLTYKNLNDYMRAIIYGCSDEDYEESLKMYTDDQCQLISLKNKDGVLSATIGKTQYQFTIDDLVRQATKVAIETIGYMKDSVYSVWKTPNAANVAKNKYGLKKTETNCMYCKFADICYHDSRVGPEDRYSRVVNEWQHLKGEDNE